VIGLDIIFYHNIN